MLERLKAGGYRCVFRNWPPQKANAGWRPIRFGGNEAVYACEVGHIQAEAAAEGYIHKAKRVCKGSLSSQDLEPCQCKLAR